MILLGFNYGVLKNISNHLPRLYSRYSIISVGEIRLAGFNASIRFRSTFKSYSSTIPE